MHASVMTFVEETVNRYGLAGAADILEVGSLDVNGTVRGLFHGRYVGVDILPGKGVDHVNVAGEPLPFDQGRFDVVVSTETLEHDPAPWVTVPEMGRVLKRDGYLILTARGNGCGFHHPPDYWRYMPMGFERLLDLAGLTPLVIRDDPQDPGVFAVARKPA